ncbi:hypothetical protein BH10ACT1_BH10ACT1_42950 [soil metagenome]
MLPEPVQTAADVAALSPAERDLVAGWLATVDAAPPLPASVQRRQRTVLVLATASAAALVPWAVLLATTLPDHHRAHAWRVAWVGFDIALAAAFATTAWYGWHRKRLFATGVVITTTLLLCDAWFDLALSWGSNEQSASIVTALIEVPLALVLMVVYRDILLTFTRGPRTRRS